MIVVAIIGILAAIALPAYQDYTGRAQASEGLKATAGLQTDIGVYLTEYNALPDVADQADGEPAVSIKAAAAALEGKYFAAGNVKVIDDGVIQVKFSDGANKDKGMQLKPNLSAAGNQIKGWTCSGVAISGGTALEKSRLPTSCQ